MQLANSRTRYGAIPQALHWLTVICVSNAWSLGQLMQALPTGPPRAFALSVHMMLGESVIALLIAQLAWRAVNPRPPPEPTRFGAFLNMVSGLTHYALYGFLAVVPVIGIVVQLKESRVVPIFGMWDLALLWPRDHEAAERMLDIHEVLANSLIILAGLHAGAALVHHYVFGDRTLARMLPGAT